jgi:hypothetical protein
LSYNIFFTRLIFSYFANYFDNQTLIRNRKMKKTMKSLLLAFSAMAIVAVQSKAQTVEEGLRHLNAERYTKAGEVFNSLANNNPTTDNYFQLGRYYLKTPNVKENLSKAEEAFTKGNALGKKSDDLNTIGLAWVKIAKEDFAGAKAITNEIIGKGKGSKDSELIYRVAEGYTLFSWANDPAEAIMLIDKALEVKKVDNPQYFIVKAKAYDIKNEGGDIMNNLQNALRFNAADKAAVYSFMAKIWLQGKNYQEAKQAIDNSIAADAEHAPAYYYLSSLHQTYQRWAEAAAAAKKYLQYGDSDCGAKLRYAKLAFTAKDFDNVRATLKEIESCNQDPIVHRLSGISKFEQNDFDGAINDLKHYIDVASKQEIFGLDYGFIGRAYLGKAVASENNREGNEDAAILNMEKAVTLEDTTFDYYTELGGYFQELRKYPKAAEFYEKGIATKKNPDGQDWFRLAVLQYQIKDWDKADESFEKVIASYKDTWAPPYILSARVKTYKNPEDTLYSYYERYQQYLDVLGEEGKANPQFKRDVIDAYKYLAGRALAVENNIVKATSLLNELLKYDPTNEEVLQLRDSINGVLPEGVKTDSVKTGAASGK